MTIGPSVIDRRPPSEYGKGAHARWRCCSYERVLSTPPASPSPNIAPKWCNVRPEGRSLGAKHRESGLAPRPRFVHKSWRSASWATASEAVSQEVLIARAGNCSCNKQARFLKRAGRCEEHPANGSDPGNAAAAGTGVAPSLPSPICYTPDMVAVATRSDSEAVTSSETHVTQNTRDTRFCVSYEDPFGDILVADDADGSGIVDENPFRFSSKYRDDETGLLHYGFRDYSPRLGRWVSRDPATDIAFPPWLLQNSGGGQLDLDPVGNGTETQDGTVSRAWVRGETRWHHLYRALLNDPLSLVDALGLVSMRIPSRLKVQFKENRHNSTDVVITAQAGDDSGRNKKGCPCIHPRFAQAGRGVSKNMLQGILHRRALRGQWQLDTDDTSYPFYPYQKLQRRAAIMTDAPGTH